MYIVYSSGGGCLVRMSGAGVRRRWVCLFLHSSFTLRHLVYFFEDFIVSATATTLIALSPLSVCVCCVGCECFLLTTIRCNEELGSVRSARFRLFALRFHYQQKQNKKLHLIPALHTHEYILCLFFTGFVSVCNAL